MLYSHSIDLSFLWLYPSQRTIRRCNAFQQTTPLAIESGRHNALAVWAPPAVEVDWRCLYFFWSFYDLGLATL